MSTKELKEALTMVRYKTDGTKQQLRDRMMGINDICEIPSDIESGGEDEDENAAKAKVQMVDDPEMPELVRVPDVSQDSSSDESSSSDSEDETIEACVTIQRRAAPTGKKKRTTNKRSKSTHAASCKSSTADVVSDDSDDDDYSPSPKKKPRNKPSASKKSGPAPASSSKNGSGHSKKKKSAGPGKKKTTGASQASAKNNGGRARKKTTSSKKKAKSRKRKKKKKTGKHFAVWARVERQVSPAPRELPERTWRQRTPPRSTCETPWSTFRKVFFTDELLFFAVKEFNHYPKFLAANRTRPPYIAKDQVWSPRWVNKTGIKGPMNLQPKEYLRYIAILYLLGVKGLSDTNLDDLFSTDPIMREEWLCKITTRQDLGRFLRQLHFEDSLAPRGETGGTDYRPDGTPTKVGLWMLLVRKRCMCFLPGNWMSFDEGTARYNGRMTSYKHKQSRFKPYDGIRIYMLNDSLTGYVANFRVDLRDKTPIAEMMRCVLEDFNVPGIQVFADNLFVSVDMLKWCKEQRINLAGTTRRTYGFPADLSCDNMEYGDFDWRMTSDGLLAVAWKDVGDTKGMSNFHLPTTDTVMRRERGNRIRVSRTAPTMFAEYNKYMGGTDLCDQRRGQYSSQRRSKKWWHALFYFTLDILMLNSWAVYNWENDSSMSQKEFIMQTAMALLGESDPFCPLTKSASVSPDLLSPAAMETPPAERFFCTKPKEASIASSRKYKSRQSNCKYCYHVHGKRTCTAFYCTGCHTPLCKRCFGKWHRWLESRKVGWDR